MLLAPFAMLFKLNLVLNEFLVFPAPVIYSFAVFTREFY
jgi:hypothetical protein